MLKILKWLVITVCAVAALGLVVILASAYFAHDHDYQHTQSTAQLPMFDPAASSGHQSRLSTIAVGSMNFRARTAGFGQTRGNVILLHGFPETSAMYNPMIPVLAEAGYQVVAFDQRGYSPQARPEETDAYATEKLAQDVYGVADAVGFEDFHLVGHDWGAGVGWYMVLNDASRILSWSALSIPHIGAYSQAIQQDPDQQSRSAYIGFFQLPWVPEILFSFNSFAALRQNVYSDHHDQIVEEYMKVLSEPGALTSALNWYRAPNVLADADGMDVTVPTAFIWGNQDAVIGRKSLEVQREFFTGNLWETELNTGHWLMETHPTEVTAAVLANLERSSG